MPRRKAAPRPAAGAALTPEERFVRVQAEAYLLAEQDGFTRDPVEYWLAAEETFPAGDYSSE